MEQPRRHSRKRDAILSCLQKTASHPDADWVYAQLKPSLPDLSLGTVYRNLTQLREDGLIQSLGTFGGVERFDGCTAPHCHFFCTDCGAILDVEADSLPVSVTDDVQNQTGGVVEGYSLVFYGLCPDCLKKQKN